MSEHITIPLTPSRASPVQAAPAMFLQRKCACGGAPGVSGECEECQANLLQRTAATASSLGAVPTCVSAALHAPGQPLHPTRANIWRAGLATTSAKCEFTRIAAPPIPHVQSMP